MINNKNISLKRISILGSSVPAILLAGKSAENNLKVDFYLPSNEEIELLKDENDLLEDKILEKINFTSSPNFLNDTDLIIDCFSETGTLKEELLKDIGSKTSSNVVYASDLFYQSVTSFAEKDKNPERIIGIHFHMSENNFLLAELVPGLKTNNKFVKIMAELLNFLEIEFIECKDSPGFVVERLNRFYFGEAIRIYEEELADTISIDWAVKQYTSLEIGPFEKLDLIGIDSDLKINKFLFNEFDFDERFKPTLLQKRMVEANRLGYKTKYGFYDYHTGFAIVEPKESDESLKWIYDRIIAVAINAAADIVSTKTASSEATSKAFQFIFNCKKDLIHFIKEEGRENILKTMQDLYQKHLDKRYRKNPYLENP